MSDKELDTFFLTFEAQHVIITINQMASMTQETEHGPLMESFPVFFEGILMDRDAQYYYLGNGIEINEAIKISSVIHIRVQETKNVYKEMLDEMPGPQKKEDVN